MNEYRMEMTITCATGDADHFYNTILMIAKGFEIGVVESKLGLFAPNEPKSSDSPPPAQTQKKVLTIKEASTYLNISKSTLYKYTTESLIPHYKIGSRTLFNLTDLDQWIEDKKVKSHV